MIKDAHFPTRISKSRTRAFPEHQHDPATRPRLPPTTTHQAPNTKRQAPSTKHQPPPSTKHQSPPSTKHQAPPSTKHQAPPSTTHQAPSAKRQAPITKRQAKRQYQHRKLKTNFSIQKARRPDRHVLLVTHDQRCSLSDPNFKISHPGFSRAPT